MQHALDAAYGPFAERVGRREEYPLHVERGAHVGRKVHLPVGGIERLETHGETLYSRGVVRIAVADDQVVRAEIAVVAAAPAAREVEFSALPVSLDHEPFVGIAYDGDINDGGRVEGLDTQYAEHLRPLAIRILDHAAAAARYGREEDQRGGKAAEKGGGASSEDACRQIGISIHGLVCVRFVEMSVSCGSVTTTAPSLPAGCACALWPYV